MNPSTRIVVSCFSGDKQQIEQSLDLWLHHGCPVTFMSPEDAPVKIVHGGVDNQHAGQRARSGPIAHARQLVYFQLLLSYPEKFFLINESDSFCLDPKIPSYLYDEPGTFWCNKDESPQFMSRDSIEQMLGVAYRVRATVEWNDRYMIALARAANIPVKNFRASVLGPISGRYDPVTGEMFTPFGAEAFGRPEGAPLSPELSKFYTDHYNSAMIEVRAGASLVHSVKNGNAAHELAAAYKEGQRA
jgi:hypothetical protein